jgi:U3 small nucleolar RNA-associated protein 6
MFAEFEQLSCIPRILQHVVDYLEQNSPQAVEAAICRFRMELFGRDPNDPEIAPALSHSLDLISSTIQQHPNETARVSEVAVRQLLSLHRLLADVDSSLQKASRAALRKYVRAMEYGEGSGDKVANVAESLLQQGKRYDAEVLIRTSIKYWATNEELQRLFSGLET